MPNNYYDMTGVLVLDKVTPVIKALFDVFDLDETQPGDGKVFIASISESSNCSWDSVLENLEDLATDLNLKLENEDGSPADTMEEVLAILAGHFNADQNAELENLIEHGSFEDDADLDALFVIAKAFDDGHGLTAYKTESAWHCSKPRLFEFGGCGDFTGSHVTVGGSSSRIVSLGENLETALASSNTDAAAETIRVEVGRILAGIYDESARGQVQEKLVQLLSA